MTVRGVTINIQNAEKALQTASWQDNVATSDARYDLRYENFNNALADFDKILKDPALTEEQKSAVNAVIQEIQQAAAKPPQ